MVILQIITGRTGEGKTKKMISLANEEAKKLTGNVVYINSSKRRRHDLSYHVRLIEPFQFNISTAQEFFGFISGVISANHDIQLIFIDELFKLTGLCIDELGDFIANLKRLSDKYSVRFVVGATCTKTEVPLTLASYLIA